MNLGRLLRWRNALDQAVVLARRGVHALVGLEHPLPGEDRRLFEKVVMPWFARDARYRRVLFVGCDWYTTHYERIFAEREYWTLEKDPRRARYGAAARHVTDALANLQQHFAPASLDLVLCNGVVGWGIDDLSAAEASFAACHAVLAEQGVLVVGWNDVPHKTPFRLEECASLRRFRAFVFPPFNSSRFLTPVRLRHTFSFFVKAG